MRLFSISFLCWCLSVLAAGAQNNCTAPDAVRAFYHEDAQQLALRMMQNNPSFQDSVEIPASLYNRSMRMLLAVYNAVQLHERDTVVECLAIHTFPSVWAYGISLGLDANETWATNFYNGIIPTGNAEFDGVLSHFNLTNSGGFIIGNTIYTSLKSETAINPVALINLVDGIPGVIFAEQEGVFGDGNNIQIQETLIEDTYITYTAAWGDCQAGCIYERNWKFVVNLNCNVQLDEVWGDELTQEVECSNSFACATEPLCLDWLRDTVHFYQALFPDCNQPHQGSTVTLMNGGTVVGLHFLIGADFDFVKFYTCDGNYLGQCLTTIAGPSCDQPVFQQYLSDPDTIWTCDQPFPTEEECGVLSSDEPPAWASSVQVTPNPTTGLFQLSALFDERRQGSVEVLNVLGQTVLRKNFQAVSVNESIDLQANAPGVYFVRVSSGREQVSRKVVVRR